MTKDIAEFQDRPGVALLWHFRIAAGDEWDEDGTARLVGIYSSEANAEAAMMRLRDKLGFRDWPDGFRIFGSWLDHDSWEEGFLPWNDA